MRQQHDVAVEHDYEFLRNQAELRELVADGQLLELRGNTNYRLARVSHPYAKPEVVLFVERLAAQYRAKTGSQLVITSLTRPASEQPRNAHKLSVHPTGMAIDFRIPKIGPDRAWLEATLLELEQAGVLDVTRERSPAHYHVAVFPDEYRSYAGSLDAKAKLNLAAAASVKLQSATSAATGAAPVASHGPSPSAPLISFLGLGFLALPAFLLGKRPSNARVFVLFGKLTGSRS